MMRLFYRNIYILAFMAMSAFMALSCSKPVSQGEPPVDSPIAEEGVLVDYQGVSPSDISDAVIYLVSKIDSLSVYVNDPDCPSLDKYIPMMKNLWTGSECRLETHRFTYNSVDASGEPVVLSARMLLVRRDGKLANLPYHRSVLYCQPYAANPEESILQLPYYARALWGDILVCPSYQGMGVDTGAGKYNNLSEIRLMGRQAVDCHLAALELMDALGVVRAVDFHTECYGVSNGGGTAAAVTRIVEQSDARIRRMIRLSSTLMIEGSMTYEPMVRSMMSGSSTVLTNVFVGMIYSFFRSHPDAFPGGTVREDFFSEWVNNYECETVYGRMHPLDAVALGALSSKDDPFWFTDIADPHKILNPSLFLGDGSLDENNPLVKGILVAASRGDVTEGWSPRTNLLILHSPEDEMISYDSVREQYLAVSDNQTNPYVKMRKFTAQRHELASMIGMLYIMLDPNPAFVLK